MRAKDFTIFIRRGDLTIAGQVDEFVELKLVLKYNSPGSFLLTVNVPGEEASMLAQQGAGIIVSYLDNLVFSGPVLHRERSYAIDESRLIAGGPDDKVVLDWRLLEPSAPPAYNLLSNTMTGVAEDVVTYFVDHHAGGAARTGRAVPGLVVAPSQGRGLTVTKDYAFDPLGDTVRALLLAGGDLGFDVAQTFMGAPARQFSVYVPGDLSSYAQFSADIGNLASFTYTDDAPKANVVTARGQPTPNVRPLAEYSDTGSQAEWGRIEAFFTDNATTPEALTTAAQQELAKDARTSATKFVPTDIEALTFGVDYGLGDRISVVIDGLPQVDVIREVDITISTDQAMVTPVIASPGTYDPTVPKYLAAIASGSRRIGTLERT